MQDKNALVLEVLRQDEALKMSAYEQKELASTLRHYSQISFASAQIQKLCHEVTSILNKADKKGLLESDAFTALKKAGQLLWEQLFTPAVKNKLKSTSLLDLVLAIDEELVSIPWELLYTGEDFLCLKFNVGRLVRTKREAGASSPQYRSSNSVLKMLVLVNPTNDLKSAYLEGINIKNQFDRQRTRMRINFKSTDIDTLYVKKNLSDYDIVHFAGHCEYDRATPEDSGWVLSDGRFTTSDILALAQGMSLPSLVFSNACSSAQAPADLVDADYQERAYSMAGAFLFSGVRHYIGAIRKIEDQASLVFAKEFYTQLIKGKSLGECLRLARLRLIHEYGITATSWTNYLLYGDPNFVFFRARPPALPPRIKIARRTFKKFFIGLVLLLIITSISLYLYMWLPTLNPSAYFLFLKAQKMYLAGRNQEVIAVSGDILKKDPRFLAVYPQLGDTYQRLGDWQKALKYYFDYALYSQKRQDKKNLASAYTGIGWIYHLHGEYPKAIEFYQQAIDLSRENKDRLSEARALERLAVWYIDQEDNDKALELLMQSSEINRERQHLREHRYGLACDYFDLGLIFTNKDDFKTAQEFYAKSRALFENLKLKYELSDYYFNLGEIYLFEKQYQKTLDCYLQGLKIDQAQGNKFSLTSDYIMLGELYVAMDNLKEGERLFNEAVTTAKQIDAQPELASAYRNLGLLFKQKGQKNKAREYLRQAQEIYYKVSASDYQKIRQELLTLN